MSKISVAVVAAALASQSMPVLAQSAPPAPPGVAQGTAPVAMPHSPPIVRAPDVMQMHVQMRDRVMTRDEVVQHVRTMFSRLDTNHDGFITKEEVAAFHARMSGMRDAMSSGMAEHRMEMHGPGEGMAMPDPNKMFDQLDTNHDGVISRQEFLAGHREMHERRIVMMRRKGSYGDGGMHAMGAGFGEHLFAMADANHDGRVSLQEAETAALAHFDRMDLNHDGRVTPEERREVHESMGAHQRP